MMAPDVVVMETSAEAAELLVFLSAGGFSRTCAVCLLVVEARRRAEAERWRCKMANKRPFLGKGIPTQQPNTFHSHPKNANRNLCHLKWTASSGKSEHLLPLLLSVSIQKQQVVGPGKTSTFLVLSLQLQAPKHTADVKRERGREPRGICQSLRKCLRLFRLPLDWLCTLCTKSPYKIQT